MAVTLVSLGAVFSWFVGGQGEQVTAGGVSQSSKRLETRPAYGPDASSPVSNLSAAQIETPPTVFAARTASHAPLAAQEGVVKTSELEPAKEAKVALAPKLTKPVDKAGAKQSKKRRLKLRGTPSSEQRKKANPKRGNANTSLSKTGAIGRRSTTKNAQIKKADTVVKKDGGRSSQTIASRADPSPQEVKLNEDASPLTRTTGPRIRPWGGATSIKLRGQPEKDGWYAVPNRGQFLSANQNGIRLLMRVFGNRDRLWAAINSKPPAKLTVNGTDYGETPIASVPLRSGIQNVRIVDGEGRILKVLFKVAR